MPCIMPCWVVLGGRVGNVIYQTALVASSVVCLLPMEGMSFHGGLVGVILGLMYTARHASISMGD